MRIAYFVPFRGGRETGIYRKVAEHCEEWTRLGAEVGLFVGTGAEAASDWSGIPHAQRVLAMPAGAASTIAARESLWRSIRSWKPDVVYARHGLVHPGPVWTASRMPVVLEVNSNDLGEFGATSRWRSAYARSTRDLLLSRAAGLVCISQELARSPVYDSGPSRRIAIGNGIRLADLPAFPLPANNNPRLVFIGHPGTVWHGLDHLLEMARHFSSWRFDLIGPRTDEVEDKPPNVVAHGTLPPEEYRPVMEQADVAVGTLALYRKGMSEDSTLKVREYLARGLPTILGHDDTDFPEPPSFMLQVPNRSDGVSSSLHRIESFVNRSRGVRVPPEAIGHLDVSVKEKERLQFIAAAARVHR